MLSGIIRSSNRVTGNARRRMRRSGARFRNPGAVRGCNGQPQLGRTAFQSRNSRQGPSSLANSTPSARNAPFSAPMDVPRIIIGPVTGLGQRPGKADFQRTMTAAAAARTGRDRRVPC